MANPTITNVAVVSRFYDLALASHCVIDGATISADGSMIRGTLLVRSAVSGKWHQYVHGTDVMSLGNVRVLKDDQKVIAGQDAFAAGMFKGMFKLSALVDVNPGLVAGDLLAAAGFQVLESDEIELK
jgi:hypothetical protein